MILKMKKIVVALLLMSHVAVANPEKGNSDFYELRIYHAETNEQISALDNYLRSAFLPALHSNGVKKVGVFKQLGIDTAADKTIYVFIPYSSVEDWARTNKKLAADKTFLENGRSFTHASAEKPPFKRMETVLMEAFSGQQHMVIPPKQQGRLYELRSYESPTENLHDKKVAMFNTGGEIPLFNRLGFDPVFYARVVAGNKMPNFMYMPIFESEEQRSAQWKRFGQDSVWIDISSRPENENKVSVSHIDSILLHATEYSDI